MVSRNNVLDTGGVFEFVGVGFGDLELAIDGLSWTDHKEIPWYCDDQNKGGEGDAEDNPEFARFEKTGNVKARAPRLLGKRIVRIA